MNGQRVRIRDQGKTAVNRWLVELLSPDGRYMISTNGSLHSKKAEAKSEAKRLADIYRCAIEAP